MFVSKYNRKERRFRLHLVQGDTSFKVCAKLKFPVGFSFAVFAFFSVPGIYPGRSFAIFAVYPLLELYQWLRLHKFLHHPAGGGIEPDHIHAVAESVDRHLDQFIGTCGYGLDHLACSIEDLYRPEIPDVADIED